MAVCKIKDIELEYEEYGTGERYLLCCQQSHSKVVNWTIDLAEKAGFHVYDIVIRGFGRSTHITEDLGDTWYDMWAQDACDFADAMGIDKFFYSGVSHGAGIGWHICVNHQERVRAFFSIVGGPHSKDGQETGSARMKTIMAAKTEEPWKAHCDACDADFSRERPEGMSEELWELKLRFHEEQIENMRNMSLEEARLNPRKPFPKQKTEEELIAVLSQVKIPVLMMGGMHDPICLPENLVRSCKAVTGSKMIIYEDATHGLDMEHKDEVVRDIVRFCEDRGL